MSRNCRDRAHCTSKQNLPVNWTQWVADFEILSFGPFLSHTSNSTVTVTSTNVVLHFSDPPPLQLLYQQHQQVSPLLQTSHCPTSPNEDRVIVIDFNKCYCIRNGLQRSHLGRNNPPQTMTASFGSLVCQSFHVFNNLWTNCVSSYYRI